MNVLIRIALPLLLAGLATAQGQTPGEPEVAGSPEGRFFKVEHGWHDFEKGAWVELKITRREGDERTERTERRTLRGIEEDGTAMVAVADPGKPGDEVLVSVEDLRIPEADLTCTNFVTQENGGVRRLNCPVLTTEGSETAKRTGQVYRLTTGMGIPTPGSLLTFDLRRPDGSTVERHVTAFDQFVEFGGRRVMGTASVEHEILAGQSTESGIEEIESPDVPGGVVSRKGKGHVLRDGRRTPFEFEETVTAFGDDPSEIEVKTRRACDDVRALFRYVPSPWKGFGAGSSVVTRHESRSADGTRTQVSRTTIEAVRSGGLTMNYEVLEHWHKANEEVVTYPASVHDVPWNTSWHRSVRVKHLGTETLKACGKEWPCELFAVVLASPMILDGRPPGDKVVEYRVWRCPDFPANDGVVRRDYGWGVRGKETVMTESRTVIDLDRICRVDGADYTCFVLRTVHDDDKSAALVESERWMCPAVPGGQLRQEVWTVSGGKRETSDVVEVTEVKVKKP